MIRVHTGRGWRYNPHLLAELRSVVGDGARPLPIVDVLGMEVDGVDLFSGLSEDRVVDVTADLATALSRLASGYRRAQVSCSGGAVELLFERRSTQVLLSMVRLRRPSEVLLRDLEIDLSALCDATRRSARDLLEELQSIHPALTESASAQRLIRALAGALGKPPRACPLAPAAAPSEAPLVAQSHAAGAAGFRLEIADEEALFESFAGGRADLHSLLASGELRIEPGGNSPAWCGRGVPFLLLKDLVQSALEVVRAIEDGDPEHELPLGNGVTLELRLGAHPTAAFVRDGPRGRQKSLQGFQPCEPIPLLAALFQAAVAFGGLATRRNARQSQNQPLATLLTDAHEGLARCRELAAPLPASAVPPTALPPAHTPSLEPKLAPGRLRLLSYRGAWTSPVGFPVRSLQPVQGGLLVHGEGGVAGLSPADGAARWRFTAEGALAEAAPGLIIAALDDTLRRVDSNSATEWQRKLGGPLRALACAGRRKLRVAVAATDSEVLAFEAATGRPLWSFSPPGAARLGVHAIRSLAVISTGDGRLYGIAPLDGKLLWRARGKLLEHPASHQDYLLASGRTAGQLTGVGLKDGEVHGFEDLDLTRVASAVSADWGLAVGGLHGAGGVVVGISPEGRTSWRWADDDRLGPAKPLLMPAPLGLLVRSARSLSRLDAQGKLQWSHPLSDHTHDGVFPVRRRGVVIAAGDAGLFAFDEESGAVLGQVDDERPIAALAVDNRLNVFLAAEDGPVRALRVGRFLSVV